ncbi:MAG: hypothetical protein HYR84_08505 [Planctomycetes bacterium]|nr:hypothetical protein [Planctomycetota bacterium]
MPGFRTVAFFLPIFFLSATATAHAGDKPANAPAVVVRFKSLDVVVQHIKDIAKLVDQEGAAEQIEGLIKSKIGKEGLVGVDTERPFGAYLRFGETIDKTNATLLIPMKNEKTFLGLLENLGVTYVKDKDGVYTHTTKKNVSVYFRFDRQYLFVTSPSPDGLQTKNLPDPAKALAMPGDAAISVLARMEQIPDFAKNKAREQVAKVFDLFRASKPAATKAQEQFRQAALANIEALGDSAIKDAADIRFDLDAGGPMKDLKVNVSVTPKPNTALAKIIKAGGDRKSTLGKIGGKDAALHASAHLAMPDALKGAFAKVVDEMQANALAGLQDDANKKEAAEFFDALRPTVQAGELDIAAAVVGPQGGHYAFLWAMKLKDGNKLAATLDRILDATAKKIPKGKPIPFRVAERVGAIAIHEFDLGDDPQLGKLVEVAGAGKLYLAIRDDAGFVGVGKAALPLLKTALAANAAAPSPVLAIDLDLGRMAAFLTQNEDQKNLAAKLFPANQDNRIRIRIDGGASLNARLQMRLNVIEFLVKMKAAGKDG